MKHVVKSLFSIALLLSGAIQADSCGNSFLLGSNVGNISGSGLIEQAGQTHRFDADDMYGVFSVHGEYNQSFKAKDLGKYFSPINSNVFKVGGANKNGTDSGVNVQNAMLLLDDAYAATITFKPVSKTFTTNMNLFVGLDNLMEGLYADVSLPIVHNKRQVKITESDVTAGNTTSASGAYTNGATSAVPYTTFTAAMVGDKTVTSSNIASDNMKYGKINGSQSHTKVGDTRLTLGYDFMRKENCHLGVGLQALINGNGKSDAVYMFEASTGTGGRHGFGGRVDGHCRLYEKDDAELNMYLQADMVHLFDATVKRSYDLTTKHGKWSRYMLFKEWTTANLAGSPTTNSVHGVNFTTLNAKVGMDLMYDVNVMMAYTNGCMGINVGYSVHGHSKEEHKTWVDTFTTKNYGAWAITVADFDTASNQDHKLATNVTINGGTSAFAAATPDDSATSNIVVLDDLDKNSGLQAKAMVHNVFGDLNYKWEDHEWAPSVGVGGSASLSSNNKAINQWGVFFHGGVSF